MFKEREGNVIGSRDKEDRVVLLPLDLIRAEVFYPQQREIIQTNKTCEALAMQAAATILAEFCDERKATSAYLSESCGSEKPSQGVFS